jgi:hypothetical protein
MLTTCHFTKTGHINQVTHLQETVQTLPIFRSTMTTYVTTVM